MATREEIKDSISTVFATGVSGGIRAVTVRQFMLTLIDSLRFDATVNIDTVDVGGGNHEWQDDILIGSPGVSFKSNGLQDSGFTFNSVTGTVTWSFPVNQNNVDIEY